MRRLSTAWWLRLLVLAMIVLAFVRAHTALASLTMPADDDFFRDIAFAQTYRQGQWLSDPWYPGFAKWYNPLTTAVASAVAMFVPRPLHEIYTQIGQYLNLLAPMAFYHLVARLFGRRIAVGSTLTYLFIGNQELPSWLGGATYTPSFLPVHFVQTFFFLAVARLPALHRSRSLGHHAAFGLLLGTILLGHVAPVILIGIAMLGVGAAAVARRQISLRALALRTVVHVATAAAVGSPFLYGHLHHGLHVQNWQPGAFQPDEFELASFPHGFLTLASWRWVLAIAGVAIAVWHGRRRPRSVRWRNAKVVLGLFGAGLALVAYGIFVQQPLGLPSIVPTWHFFFYGTALAAVFAGFFVWFASRVLAKLARAAFERIGRRASSTLSTNALCGVVIALVATFYPRYARSFEFQAANESEKYRLGRYPEMYAWLSEHTRPEDVFLVPPDAGLYVVGPTARKLVSAHPLFANPYASAGERWEDTAEMYAALRHDDASKFASLREKYDVRYVLRVRQAVGNVVDSDDVPPILEGNQDLLPAPPAFLTEVFHLRMISPLYEIGRESPSPDNPAMAIDCWILAIDEERLSRQRAERSPP